MEICEGDIFERCGKDVNYKLVVKFIKHADNSLDICEVIETNSNRHHVGQKILCGFLASKSFWRCIERIRNVYDELDNLLNERAINVALENK